MYVRAYRNTSIDQCVSTFTSPSSFMCGREGAKALTSQLNHTAIWTEAGVEHTASMIFPIIIWRPLFLVQCRTAQQSGALQPEPRT